jgi:hypothetical protein
MQRATNVNPTRAQLQFPDCVFMIPAPSFDGRNGLAELPFTLKITKQQDIIRQVADIDGALQRHSYCAGLRQNHDGEYAAIA